MKKRVFSEIEIIQVCNLYASGNSLRKVAKISGIRTKSVLNILKSNGVPRRQSTYSLNENYFEQIDSAEKAYIIGLLYADGSVNKKQYNVKITLQEKDKDILDKINNLLGSDRKLNFISKPNERSQNYYSLTVSNKKICEQLIKVGVVPNKAFKIRLPNLEDNLIFHFIRGYFDGDGYTNTDKRKKQTGCFALVSNVNFCEDVQNFLKQHGIGSKIYIHSTRNLNSAEIRINKFNDIKNIYNLIYSNSTIHINRKYLKFKSFVEAT